MARCAIVNTPIKVKRSGLGLLTDLAPIAKARQTRKLATATGLMDSLTRRVKKRRPTRYAMNAFDFFIDGFLSPLRYRES
jgi:hypothetical protein